jgi:hypothetical protein
MNEHSRRIRSPDEIGVPEISTTLWEDISGLIRRFFRRRPKR